LLSPKSSSLDDPSVTIQLPPNCCATTPAKFYFTTVTTIAYASRGARPSVPSRTSSSLIVTRPGAQPRTNNACGALPPMGLANRSHGRLMLRPRRRLDHPGLAADNQAPKVPYRTSRAERENRPLINAEQ
jgi:hypothetical protein